MSTPYARTKVGVVGAASVSVDLSGKATEIILSSTTDCWINFNDAAVANACFYLPADSPVTVTVSSKESLSVIQDAAGGFLSVLEQANVRLINTVHEFFKGDASLLSSAISTSFKGDSSLKLITAATATGDSSLLKAVEASASGDSNLLATVSATLTGDSTLVTP